MKKQFKPTHTMLAADPKNNDQVRVLRLPKSPVDSNGKGWLVVEFSDGGRLRVHENYLKPIEA